MLDPWGMPMLAWADATALQLDQYGSVYRLDSEDDWRTWAAYVISLPTVNESDPPLPDDFASFRDWAQRFVGSFNLVV